MTELFIFTRNPNFPSAPFAFTADWTGSNLPERPEGWKLFKKSRVLEGMIGFENGEPTRIWNEVGQFGYSIKN